MSGLSLNNKTIDKYFRYLKKLDISSKKKLIEKLEKSIEEGESGKKELPTLFGAWEDERTSDEIIEDIKSSRVENRNIEQF